MYVGHEQGSDLTITGSDGSFLSYSELLIATVSFNYCAVPVSYSNY